MEYVLKDFSAGATVSLERMALSYQSQILKINQVASSHLQDRLPEEVHNLMILVDDIVDAYLTRMNEALGKEYVIGFGGVTAFELFQRCYLDLEEFVENDNAHINIYEIWSAFALARISEAISCLLGCPVDDVAVKQYGSKKTAQYALAGDALVQATEAIFMIERMKNGVPIDGESKEEKKKRESQHRSVAMKKFRAKQVKLAKEKAFDLFVKCSGENPGKSKSKVVDEILNPLDEFIAEKAISLTCDGLYETVLRWLLDREKWEERGESELRNLFVGKDDLKTY